MDKVEKVVAEALSVVTGRNFETVDPQSRLIADLGLESIDMMNLFVEIERRLNTTIHLVELIRGQSDMHGYSRDLKIVDITSYLQSRKT